jgi:hypothetical protein
MRSASLLFVTMVAAVLAAAWPASGARPHQGARYLGFEGSETRVDNLLEVTARVRVSASGRRFRGGSYVRLWCGRDDAPVRKLSLAGTHISRNGRFSKTNVAGTHISRNGRFSKTNGNGRGRVRYRLRGRFVLRDYARVTYSASKPRRSGRRCRSGRRKVALYENGEPPFRSCRSQRAKDDLRNADGRVFQQYRGGADFGDFTPYTYACLFSEDERYLLGRNWDDESIEIPRLTAPYVAYVSRATACCSAVDVRDLRDGALLRSARASETMPGQDVTDLVLKANGSVAWIVDLAPDGVEVVAVDSSGRRLLDSGPDVELRSLELNGSTVTWRKAGQTRSANLN